MDVTLLEFWESYLRLIIELKPYKYLREYFVFPSWYYMDFLVLAFAELARFEAGLH